MWTARVGVGERNPASPSDLTTWVPRLWVGTYEIKAPPPMEGMREKYVSPELVPSYLGCPVSINTNRSSVTRGTPGHRARRRIDQCNLQAFNAP